LADIFKNSGIEFVFQFSCKFAFYQLFIFQTGHRK